MQIIFWLVCLTSLVYFIIFIILLRNWRPDRAYLFYFLFVLSGLIWVVVGDLEVSKINTTQSVNNILSKLDFTFASLMSFCVAMFAMHFPKQNIKIKLIHEIGLFIPIIFSIVITWLDLVFIPAGDTSVYNLGWYYSYYAIIVFYYIVIALIPLAKKTKKASGTEKIQLRYITWSYLISTSIGLGFSLFFAYHTYISPLFGVADILTLIFAFGSSYAMLRYRFMDVHVIIRKGITYSISLLLTLAVYTYIALTLKETIEKSWNISTTWTAVILIGLVALGFPPLKNLVEKAINSLFKGQKSIDLAVKEVRDKIAEKTDLESLTNLIGAEVKKYLGVDEALIYVIDHKEQKYLVEDGEGAKSLELKNDLIRYFEKYSDILIYDEIPHLLEERTGKFEREMLQKAEKELKKHKASSALPFKTEEEIFGFLLIGERSEGKAYTVQDVQFLEKVREQTAFTIANALLYKEAMARIKTLQPERI